MCACGNYEFKRKAKIFSGSFFVYLHFLKSQSSIPFITHNNTVSSFIYFYISLRINIKKKEQTLLLLIKFFFINIALLL